MLTAGPGLIYYRSNCKEGCTNCVPNLSEAEITTFVQQALDKIYFTPDELADIEKRAATELRAISQDRDKKLNDLHIRQRNIVADIEYLTLNRISLIRTGGMTPEAVVAEETRLNGSLSKIHEEIRAYGESAHEMLQYVISFSELVRNASTYFKYALDSEKREIATQVFYEIVVTDKKVENYVARDGFDALLRRAGVTGGPSAARTLPTSNHMDILARFSPTPRTLDSRGPFYKNLPCADGRRVFLSVKYNRRESTRTAARILRLTAEKRTRFFCCAISPTLQPPVSRDDPVKSLVGHRAP